MPLSRSRARLKQRAARAAGGTALYLDRRLPLVDAARATLRKAFPDHWSFLLGELALYSFVVLLVTGVWLTPFAARSAGLLAVVFGLLAVLGAVAQINPVWNYGPLPARPGLQWGPARLVPGVRERPAMRLLPGFETRLWGHTVSWNPYLPSVVFPLLFFLVLYLYPWHDRTRLEKGRGTGDVAQSVEGGYRESYAPVPARERHAVVARQVPRPLPTPPAGSPAGRLSRLGRALSGWFHNDRVALPGEDADEGEPRDDAERRCHVDPAGTGGHGRSL
ncbi:cytochrome b [Streptomyces cellulosae]|nr:cytochrome b [Streptomyces cellulosae]WTB73672.1 cytochrome b [Streptomyces cellulosae]